MKADVYNLEGRKIKTVDLPSQFNEEIRNDLIKRAVLTMQSNKRQRYGANPEAGKRYSAKLYKRRNRYKSSYGHGISRIPRKILTRRGRNFFWVGAFAPGTVGGRKAHPPKPGKNWKRRINIKERRKAIRSALAATINLNLVRKRGHSTSTAPLILDSKFESLNKTKEIINVLKKLKLGEELKRASKRKIRAGRGKSRGRKYITKKGPLIITSQDCTLLKSAKNIPGIDVCIVNLLNTELLAPGTTPGRLCIFTDKAIERLAKEKLFK